MNTITENHRHRRSIRLPEYDYSSEGLYFITICVHERRSLFGTIVDGVMHLNDAGRMVEDEYHRLPEKYPHITCHEYIVMPNHFHCIIQIHPQPSTVGASLVGAPKKCVALYLSGTHKRCPYGSHIQLCTPNVVAKAVNIVITTRSTVLHTLSFLFSV